MGQQPVQTNAQQTDNNHIQGDEVEAEGAAGIIDPVAEAVFTADHLRRHDHNPGDPCRDPQGRDHLGQDGGQGDFQQQLLPVKPIVFGNTKVDNGDSRHRRHRRHRQRKKRRHKDQKYRRRVADPEPQNGKGYPGQWRQVAKEVDPRQQCRPDAVPAAQPQAQGHAENRSQAEAHPDTEQRRHDVTEEPPRMHLIGNALKHCQWRR